jgi:hypothetical protein
MVFRMIIFFLENETIMYAVSEDLRPRDGVS